MHVLLCVQHVHGISNAIVRFKHGHGNTFVIKITYINITYAK